MVLGGVAGARVRDDVAVAVGGVVEDIRCSHKERLAGGDDDSIRDAEEVNAGMPPHGELEVGCDIVVGMGDCREGQEDVSRGWRSDSDRMEVPHNHRGARGRVLTHVHAADMGGHARQRTEAAVFGVDGRTSRDWGQ